MKIYIFIIDFKRTVQEKIKMQTTHQPTHNYCSHSSANDCNTVRC